MTTNQHPPAMPHDETPRNRIVKGMMTNSGGILLSRVTGLIREILIARLWGTGTAAAAFTLAFTVPNLFRNIIGEGALSESFIPLFTEKNKRDGREYAYRFSAVVISVLTLILTAIVLMVVTICLVIGQFTIGDLAGMVVIILPILMPYTIFLCVFGIVAAVLNSQNHYTLTALAPILLNLVMIVMIGFVCPWISSDPIPQLIALSIAVTISGALQLLVLFPVLNRFNFRYQFIPDFEYPDLRKLAHLAGPVAFSSSIMQLNVLCDRCLAGLLGAYAVTSLAYCERIVYLPVGIFAVALAITCRPEFSRSMANHNRDEMMESFYFSIRHILFLTLPCVLILMVLGEPLVVVLFQRGEFDQQSTQMTVDAIKYYAPGIPAFAAAKIFRAGYISLQDTKTPARISLQCVVLNLVLNLILMWHLKQCGLALATTISAYVNVILLSRGFMMNNNGGKDMAGQYIGMLTRLIIALVVSWWILMATTRFLPTLNGDDLVGRLGVFIIPSIIAMLTYLIVSLLLGAREPRELYQVLTDKFTKKI